MNVRITSSRSIEQELSMVLEKPKKKELAKIEALKVKSDHLINPLKEVCMVYLVFFLCSLHVFFLYSVCCSTKQIKPAKEKKIIYIRIDEKLTSFPV
jgi:hypothetical protein